MSGFDIIPKELASLYEFVPITMDDTNIKIGLVKEENLLVIIENLKLLIDFQLYNFHYEVINSMDFIKIFNRIYNNDLKEESVIDLVDNMIIEAIDRLATDIHIEPDDYGIIIRFRILGELHVFRTIKNNKIDEFMARIKIMFKLDITEKRKPQDGRMIYEVDDKSVDIRISILPLLKGEKIVLRLLDKDSFSFNKMDLGFNTYDLNILSRSIKKESGLILVVGPAGSGKTTTLYTILNEIKTEKNNIMTIEDPVEYTFSGLNQSQIDLTRDYTFEKALNSILRQDPDIIMIGELRNELVSNIAIRAAETGHLVLTTLHSKDSATSIFRLIGMDIDRYGLASSLDIIIAQRLVKILCDECKESYKVSKEDIKELGLDMDKDYYFYRSKGCELCLDGYIKRVPIVEIVKVDKELRELIINNPLIDDIYDLFIKNKVELIKSSSIDLLLKGKTSLEEIYKLIY